MGDKTFEPDQRERAREVLRRVVDADFGGNMSEAARRLGLSQAFISEVLRGVRGAGPTMLKKLRAHTGHSYDELLGEAAESDDPYPHRARAVAFMRPFVRARAIEVVRGTALEPTVDLSPIWWANRIQQVDEELAALERAQQTRPAKPDPR